MIGNRREQASCGQNKDHISVSSEVAQSAQSASGLVLLLHYIVGTILVTCAVLGRGQACESAERLDCDLKRSPASSWYSEGEGEKMLMQKAQQRPMFDR